MALSRQQRIWLAILPKVSSIFSLFGSMWIIIEVASERRKRSAPYHRLLLAMSVYDVLESVWNFGSTWPIPTGSPDIIWALGNTASCEAQGFFLTLSVAVPLYNAMLSFYYVLVINYNYSDAKLRTFIEPSMHLVCFVWAFGTAMYSALAGLLNNANLWCWIAPLPADCKDSWTYGTAEEGNPNPCIRGDNVWVYRFGFYFIPLWVSIFLATFATYLVYRYVYQRDKATLRYRFPDRASIFGALKSLSDDMKLKLAELSTSMGFKARSSTTGIDVSAVGEFDSSENCDDSHIMDERTSQEEGKNKYSNCKDRTASEERYSEQQTDGEQIIGEINIGGALEVVHEQSAEMEVSKRSSFEERPTAFQVMSNENVEDITPDQLKHSLKKDARYPTGVWAVSLDEEMSAEAEMGSSAFDSAEETAAKHQEFQQKSNRRSTLKRRISEWKAKRERFALEMPHTFEVFHQACFYLGAFYCTHIWSTSSRIVQAITGGGTVFPLLALHAFFDPFQGFLNYLVYQRPRYIQLRKRHPDFSRIAILLFILRFSFMGGNNAGNLRKSGEARDDDRREMPHSKRSKMGLSSNFIGGESSKITLLDDPNNNSISSSIPNSESSQQGNRTSTPSLGETKLNADL